MTDDVPLLLNIGALSKACGVPVSTLRTWERRYGRPSPARSSGGQRVYATEEIAHLRAIRRALELGHRPNQVLRADMEQLQGLLGEGNGARPVIVRPAARPGGDAGSPASDLLDAVIRADIPTLTRELRAIQARDGLSGMILHSIAPLLSEIGVGWAEGRVTVYQEHLASARIGEVLRAAWQPLSDDNRGPVVLLALLPGHEHALGLEMVAGLMVSAGWRVQTLVRPAPVRDIAACVIAFGARAVMLSIAEGAETDAGALVQLREALDEDTLMVIGGRGAPEPPPGVTRFAELEEVSDWAALHR